MSVESDSFNWSAENGESAEEAESYEPEEAKSSAREDNGENGTLKTYVMKDEVDFGSTNHSANNATEEEKIAKSNEKIIRTGWMRAELKNYDKDKFHFYDLIKKHGAFVSEENEQRETYRISNTLVIKVANSQFDQFMAGLSESDGIANLDYKRSNAVDVGEEYYDLQARIKTKKEVEKRYLEILRQAKTIKDILSVEDQLRVIREEIESKEGRLKFLSDQVSRSTINLEIYQNLEYDAPRGEKPGFFNKLGNAFVSGWNAILKLIIGLIYLWPLWLGIILVLTLLKRKDFFKRFKR
jgi:hypothetical protein